MNATKKRSHMNAPLSLILASVFVIHPFFMHRIVFRFPDIGVFLMFFIGVSMMLASMWLYIGFSEHRFFSNWEKRFTRFASFKNQVDRELKNAGVFEAPSSKYSSAKFQRIDPYVLTLFKTGPALLLIALLM
jgi:hypothetical protein